MNKNVLERQFVLKLYFRASTHADGLSIINRAIFESSKSQEQMSSDQREAQSLAVAIAMETDLAVLRRALY